MQDFRDKVAVITGAASGIGRGIADRCLEEGMKIVLADVEQGALDRAEQQLKNAGAEVLAVPTDVSKAEQVESLARRTLDAFGAVHLLFNNAGVSGGSGVMRSTPADWQWILGVNLWGVIHGVRTFVPIMLAQGSEAHIVNTASIAGLISFGGPYAVSKHAVVALSESLHGELQQLGVKVKVSVLCPGWVNTKILDAARNRPAALQNDPAQATPITPEAAARMLMAQQLIATGMQPEQVADLVFEAIRDEKFYIITHPEMKPLIQRRADRILSGQNPSGMF